jgi:hypothetical protein
MRSSSLKQSRHPDGQSRALPPGWPALAQERFRLLILPLVFVEHCEAVEAIRDIRMLAPERFLSDGQRSHEERFVSFR